MTPCSLVEIRVYDRDGSTYRATIGATGTRFVDPLGEIGSAQLAVPLVQAVVAADPTLLTDGIIKVATNLTGTATMTEIVGFLCDGGELTLIAEEEEKGKQQALECPGLLELFKDLVVHPEGGVLARSAQTRTFGWMSGESANWFDQTQWDGTLRGGQWKDQNPDADRYQLPAKWPDPNAYWVDAGDNKVKQYFRTKVTLDQDTRVKVFVSADERVRVYHNSELIIKNNSEENGYTEMSTWRHVLGAGTHTFGIMFTKEYDSVFPSWPGFGDATKDFDRMIFSLARITYNGQVYDIVRHTNLNAAQWLCASRDDGVHPPTWTAAGILGKLRAEAIVYGVTSMSTFTLDFDKDVDSDGVSWPDQHERSFRVGDSGRTVIAALGEHDMDLDLTPDMVLHAYVDQGSDLSATVALVKGVNLLRYSADVTPVYATTLLVRTANRWIERTDSTAEATYGRREAFLEVGGALSREQGRHHADRALDDLARPRASYTAVMVATTGCVPYLDFGKGDTIMAYDRDLTAAPMRVVSISADITEGPVKWTLELEEP